MNSEAAGTAWIRKAFEDAAHEIFGDAGEFLETRTVMGGLVEYVRGDVNASWIFFKAGYELSEARPVPQPATEPTIEESLRLIRKMEMCEGNAAKLVLLKNFVIRAALALRDVSQGQSDAEMLAMVLRNIALGHDCCCDHSDESCCNKVRQFCPTCIAEVALAARQVPVSSEKEKK